MSSFLSDGHEILTPDEMAEADRLSIASGMGGFALMEAAGHAVKAVVLDHYPNINRAIVLCGPGNNGGDGYVAARLLAGVGIRVSLYKNTDPKVGSDAAKAAQAWSGATHALTALTLNPGDVVIDALYGAGFRGSLEGADTSAAELVRGSGAPVIAVDLPSGLSGQSGQVDGISFHADHTVTFFRKKPGHLLQPGRDQCGEVHVADIGISARVLAGISPSLQENGRHVYESMLPRPAVTTHKYARGSVGVFSGEAYAAGAARLSAAAAARGGAGAVTLLGPDAALPAMAAHITSAMLRKAESLADIEAIGNDSKFNALIIGPGFG
jgi:ADP-dependent NAD(P)H-hydrate dehydratase / NAD(P)H-hydrate epimerase